MGEGGLTAVAAAALLPERTSGLVTFGSGARVESAEDYPFGLAPYTLDGFEGEILARWGEALFAELEAPSVASDPVFVEWRSEYLRLAASSSGSHRAAAGLTSARRSRARAPRPHDRRSCSSARAIGSAPSRLLRISPHASSSRASCASTGTITCRSWATHRPSSSAIDSFVRQVVSHDPTIASRKDGAA